MQERKNPKNVLAFNLPLSMGSKYLRVLIRLKFIAFKVAMSNIFLWFAIKLNDEENLVLEPDFEKFASSDLDHNPICDMYLSHDGAIVR